MASEVLKAGRELDEEVAQKVMGWTLGNVKAGFMPWYPKQIAGTLRRVGGSQSVDRYSTDIEAAFSVVERMRELGWQLQLNGFLDSSWRAQFVKTKHGALSIETGDTAAEAICLAALSALKPKADT